LYFDVCITASCPPHLGNWIRRYRRIGHAHLPRRCHRFSIDGNRTSQARLVNAAPLGAGYGGQKSEMGVSRRSGSFHKPYGVQLAKRGKMLSKAPSGIRQSPASGDPPDQSGR
jgi:hypothetical protein